MLDTYRMTIIYNKFAYLLLVVKKKSDVPVWTDVSGLQMCGHETQQFVPWCYVYLKWQLSGWFCNIVASGLRPWLGPKARNIKAIHPLILQLCSNHPCSKRGCSASSLTLGCADRSCSRCTYCSWTEASTSTKWQVMTGSQKMLCWPWVHIMPRNIDACLLLGVCSCCFLSCCHFPKRQEKVISKKIKDNFSLCSWPDFIMCAHKQNQPLVAHIQQLLLYNSNYKQESGGGAADRRATTPSHVSRTLFSWVTALPVLYVLSVCACVHACICVCTCVYVCHERGHYYVYEHLFLPCVTLYIVNKGVQKPQQSTRTCDIVLLVFHFQISAADVGDGLFILTCGRSLWRFM